MSLNYRAAQILRTIKKHGAISLLDMRSLGLTGTETQPLHKVLESVRRSGYVMCTRQDETVYNLTDKGKEWLHAHKPEDDEVPTENIVPGRTIWNSTSRELYRTGMGAGRIGIAMIGV